MHVRRRLLYLLAVATVSGCASSGTSLGLIGSQKSGTENLYEQLQQDIITMDEAALRQAVTAPRIRSAATEKYGRIRLGLALASNWRCKTSFADSALNYTFSHLSDKEGADSALESRNHRERVNIRSCMCEYQTCNEPISLFDDIDKAFRARKGRKDRIIAWQRQEAEDIRIDGVQKRLSRIRETPTTVSFLEGAKSELPGPLKFLDDPFFVRDEFESWNEYQSRIKSKGMPRVIVLEYEHVVVPSNDKYSPDRKEMETLWMGLASIEERIKGKGIGLKSRLWVKRGDKHLVRIIARTPFQVGKDRNSDIANYVPGERHIASGYSSKIRFRKQGFTSLYRVIHEDVDSQIARQLMRDGDPMRVRFFLETDPEAGKFSVERIDCEDGDCEVTNVYTSLVGIQFSDPNSNSVLSEIYFD